MPKITLGITGLHEILGRDYRSEEPCLGPSSFFQRTRTHFSVATETCLPSETFFWLMPRLQCLLSKQSYFVYLKNLGAKNLYGSSRLRPSTQRSIRHLVSFCGSAIHRIQEIQLHETLYPAGDAISSACVARLPSR